MSPSPVRDPQFNEQRLPESLLATEGQEAATKVPGIETKGKGEMTEPSEQELADIKPSTMTLTGGGELDLGQRRVRSSAGENKGEELSVKKETRWRLDMQQDEPMMSTDVLLGERETRPVIKRKTMSPNQELLIAAQLDVPSSFMPQEAGDDQLGGFLPRRSRRHAREKDVEQDHEQDFEQDFEQDVKKDVEGEGEGPTTTAVAEPNKTQERSLIRFGVPIE